MKRSPSLIAISIENHPRQPVALAPDSAMQLRIYFFVAPDIPPPARFTTEKIEIEILPAVGKTARHNL